MIDAYPSRIHSMEPRRNRDWLQNKILAFFDANDADEYLTVADVVLKFEVSIYKAGLSLKVLKDIGILERISVKVGGSTQVRYTRKKESHEQ